MWGKRLRLAGLLLLPLCALTARADDRFIEGYATAVLERDLDVHPDAVEMQDGVLLVYLRSLQGEPVGRIRDALANIRGVERVEIRQVPEATATHRDESTPSVVGEQEPAETEVEEQEDTGLELFPRRELFEPLLADVRWPRFSASEQTYIDDSELAHVGSATVAESFALLAGDLGEQARWEVGLHAGVFSIFDLDAPSTDLVNADYLVGPTLAIRSGIATGFLRIFHQSSHLGDEYLLRKRPQRVDLSFEAVNALLSLDPLESVRVYGGGGYIIRDSPTVHPLSAQAGMELRSPWSVFTGIVRPVAGIDLRWAEEDHWQTDVSVRAGLRIESPRLSRLRLHVLFEYFRGYSPNGQFFVRRIEYAGVGLYLDL